MRNCWCVFDLPTDEKEIAALEEEAAAQGFWDVPETAQRKMQRLSDLKGRVEDWQTLETQAASLEELLLLSIEGGMTIRYWTPSFRNSRR